MGRFERWAAGQKTPYYNQLGRVFALLIGWRGRF